MTLAERIARIETELGFDLQLDFPEVLPKTREHIIGEGMLLIATWIDHTSPLPKISAPRIEKGQWMIEVQCTLDRPSGATKEVHKLFADPTLLGMFGQWADWIGRLADKADAEDADLA